MNLEIGAKNSVETTNKHQGMVEICLHQKILPQKLAFKKKIGSVAKARLQDMESM